MIVSLLLLLAAVDLFPLTRNQSPERIRETGTREDVPSSTGFRRSLAQPNDRSSEKKIEVESGVKNEHRLPVPKAAFMRKACNLPPRWATFIHRGWNPGPERRADLIIVPKPPNFVGTPFNTSHSGPYLWLQRVPLVFYGPGYVKALGHFDPGREVTSADIAPTYAEILGYSLSHRQGAPLREILEPATTPPRLIVTVSIDGGGWNVLNRWPGAWPHLSSLMQDGTSIDGAVVGSSPSITPAIHTTMSTGVFPRRHGVTAIAVRNDDGAIVGAFTPSTNDIGVPVQPTLTLQTTTIGDLWDLENDNKPKVGLIASGNYPLGMLGRGAALRGADKDIALFPGRSGNWRTDPRYYSKPSLVHGGIPRPARFLAALDKRDGKADGRWKGHDLSTTQFSNTPAAAPWEIRTATALMSEEGFGHDPVTDLLYLHFKSPDHAGHKWNMIAPEMRDVVSSVDSGIGALVRWLDARVGERNYVLAVTADHGQTPLDRDGWPINREEILADIQARFDHVADDQGIIQRTSASSLFSNAEEMRVNGVTPAQVSSFLSGYTISANSPEGSPLPKKYASRRNERIFTAVFPGRKLPAVMACTGAAR